MSEEHHVEIKLPITDENKAFVKEIIVSIMSALPTDEDRTDIMRRFCIYCGNLEKYWSCTCQMDC